MKPLRYALKGQEEPGILDENGVIRSLEGQVGDIADATLGGESLARLAAVDISVLPEVAPDARIGPYMGNVRKFICIGLNYADHAAESGMSLLEEPVVFFKTTSAIIGPDGLGDGTRHRHRQRGKICL